MFGPSAVSSPSVQTAALFCRAQIVVLLPMLGYGIFLGKSLFVSLNPAWAFFLLGWAVAATLLGWWLMRAATSPLLDGVDRRASQLAIGMIVVAATVTIAVSILQVRSFALANAEDTAYYGQVLWNTWHGSFLSGNLQQQRLYNPPVSTDLALHLSGALLMLVPVYGLLPHVLTLLVVRDLALAAAAWPLFLLARERMGGTAAIAAVGLYLLNPAVLAQSADAFHLSQLAPLPFFCALRAFVRAEFVPFAFWMVATIVVREDVAITMVGFAVWALVRRRSLPWLAMSVGVPVVWWGIVTLLIQPAFGRWGNSVVEMSFTGGRPARFGVFEVLLGNPAAILERVLNDGLYYLYAMLRSVGFLAVLGSAGLLASAGLAANLLFARMFYPAGDPLSRFALLPACALVGAAVVIMSHVARSSGDIRVLGIAFLLLLPSASLLDGAKEAVRTRLEPHMGTHAAWNDAAALREGLERIPATASVAAPNYVLPALSNRPKLFSVLYLHMYPQAERPDYLLLDRNLDRMIRNPELRSRYAALLERVSQSRDYETVWEHGEYFILRRIERSA
jgi:uncharacterized membrane protein